MIQVRLSQMSISSCPRLEELYLAKLFKTFNDPQEGHCRVGKSKYLETAIQWGRGPAVELADLHLAACFLLFLVADYENSQGTTGFSPSQTLANCRAGPRRVLYKPVRALEAQPAAAAAAVPVTVTVAASQRRPP
jgi:hypothetical protein